MGGSDGIRTRDLLDDNQTLWARLSYTPNADTIRHYRLFSKFMPTAGIEPAT